MKTISLTMENLSNGMIRITGRNNGCTVKYVDGIRSDAKNIFNQVANATASSHMVGGVLSEEFVSISNELKKLI